MTGYFKKDDSEPTPFINQGFNSEIHSPNHGLPSPDSSNSSDNYNGFFRRSIIDKLSNYKDKVKSYFKTNNIPNTVNIPRGIYQEGGRDMYNGMPLPRVETLANGTEYYLVKDDHNFIRFINNSFNSEGFVEVLNPFSGKIISRIPATVNERISMINKARGSAIFTAPENSFIRNPEFEGVDFMGITTPSSSQVIEKFNEIDLTPRASTSNLPVMDIDNPFS
jgi:hypothetical protein